MGASLLLEAGDIGARTAHRVLVLHTRDRPFDSPSCVTLETASNVAAAFPFSFARRAVRKETDLLRSNLLPCWLPSIQLDNLLTYYSPRDEVIVEVYCWSAISYTWSLCFIVRVGKEKDHCKNVFIYFFTYTQALSLFVLFAYLFSMIILCIIFACHASTLSHNCGFPSACQTCESLVTSVLSKHRQQCV